MDQSLTGLPRIHGVTLTELRQICDERGAVLHMLRNDAAEFTRFGECYFSEIRPGSIKAWKLHRAQTQNLAVPVGRVRLAIYDGRDYSPTCGALQVLELGRPDAYMRIKIPTGLWYGFSCISSTPALLCNCADIPHSPDECEARPVSDPGIPYSWMTGSGMAGN